MPNQEVFKRVYVDVESNIHLGKFGQERAHNTQNKPVYRLTVELNESELELKGEHFIAAVRGFLRRTLRYGDKVMIVDKGTVSTERPDSQVFGFMVNPDTLKITDQREIAT